MMMEVVVEGRAKHDRALVLRKGAFSGQRG